MPVRSTRRQLFSRSLSYSNYETRSYPGGLGPARYPPSRINDWPVIKDARSEQIHKTASATSVGFPRRPRGWSPIAYFLISGAPKARSPISVSITAGHTAFTRIRFRAFSSAATFVKPITPCLLALYVAAPTKPDNPSTDAVLTIAPPPPCLSICRISYFKHNHTPLRLMLMTRSQSSSDWLMIAAVLPSIPALLNATSSLPNFSTAFFTRFSTSEAFDTSVFTNKASPPAARTNSTLSFPSVSRLPATTTFAPAFAKSIAVSRPIPDVPPVTSAVLPSNSLVIISSHGSSPPRCRAESRLWVKFASSACGASVSTRSATSGHHNGGLGVECSTLLEVREQPPESFRDGVIRKFVFGLGIVSAWCVDGRWEAIGHNTEVFSSAPGGGNLSTQHSSYNHLIVNMIEDGGFHSHPWLLVHRLRFSRSYSFRFGLPAATHSFCPPPAGVTWR